MVRKVFVFMLMFFMLMVSASYAGNINNFNNVLVDRMGFSAGPADLNSFKMFKKGKVLVGVRNIKGWTVGGFVVAPCDAPANDMIYPLSLIYSALHDNLADANDKAESKVIMAGGVKVWVEKMEELFHIAVGKLGDSLTRETVFLYDGLLVRAVDAGQVGIHSDGRADKKTLSIKLWIP